MNITEGEITVTTKFNRSKSDLTEDNIVLEGIKIGFYRDKIVLSRS